MSEEDYFAALDADIVERFKTAVAIGKWPDGRVLTADQKETCMRAIIMFEHKNVPENERTGYVPPKETPCDTKKEEVETIKWK